MIRGCGRQLRAGGGTGHPFGLDFGAVMTMGAALGCDMALLAEVLPSVERAILDGIAEVSDGD